jgi:hypothetical protein
MQKSDDERIRFMSATWIYERAWGKPRDYDPREADAGSLKIDVHALTAEQRAVLLAIVQSGAVKPAVIDGDTSVTTLDAATATEPRPA